MEKRRYVGIDLGKRTYELTIIGKKGKVSLSNGTTDIEGRHALYKKLEATDKVAIEAGTMSFIIAKELMDIVGCEVVILNPGKLALIYGSMKKTDKEDALKPAHIIEQFRDEQLPAVPLPSEQEINRRKLISGHEDAVRLRTQMINYVHGLFLQQGITTVVKKDLATKGNREAAVQQLTGLEKEQAQWALATIDLHEAQIAKLDALMAKERKDDALITLLMGIPGVGPIVALAYAAFIGDGSRFESASQVANYLGLVPRVDISGSIVRYGGITKRGNGYLRSLPVQAAWALLKSKSGGALKERYVYMTQIKGLGKKKTIIAIARRLAELMWSISRSGKAYEVRKFAIPTQKGARLAKEALSA
ncbi:IS110 family RNA-guided transposase [Breznakiellaceae bacterium SP9]